jgi:hypothetical protein
MELDEEDDMRPFGKSANVGGGSKSGYAALFNDKLTQSRGHHDDNEASVFSQFKYSSPWDKHPSHTNNNVNGDDEDADLLIESDEEPSRVRRNKAGQYDEDEDHNYSIEARYKQLQQQQQSPQSHTRPSSSGAGRNPVTASSTNNMSYGQPVRGSISSLDTANDGPGPASYSAMPPIKPAASSSNPLPAQLAATTNNIVRTRPSLGATTASTASSSSSAMNSGNNTGLSTTLAPGSHVYTRSSSAGRTRPGGAAGNTSGSSGGRTQTPTPRTVAGGTGGGRQAAASTSATASNHNFADLNYPQATQFHPDPAENAKIHARMKELREQLQFYAEANAQLKGARKQQENAKAELELERSNVRFTFPRVLLCLLMRVLRVQFMNWVTEQKAAVSTWCEEQKKIITNERRALAKQSKELKAAGGALGSSGTGTMIGGSVRKERAEIEALQVTLEKVKVDSEAALKKLRMSEKRLLQLSRDNAAKIDELETSLQQSESDRATLVAFVTKLQTKLPPNIVALLGKEAAAMRDNNVVSRKKVDDAIVEEIDFGDGDGIGAAFVSHAVVTSNNEAKNSHRHPSSGGDKNFVDAPSTGKLATAIFNQTVPSAVHDIPGKTGTKNNTLLHASEDTAGSWAHSSRSSRGSRYSSHDDDENDDHEDQEQDSDQQYSMALTGSGGNLTASSNRFGASAGDKSKNTTATTPSSDNFYSRSAEIEQAIRQHNQQHAQQAASRSSQHLLDSAAAVASTSKSNRLSQTTSQAAVDDMARVGDREQPLQATIGSGTRPGQQQAQSAVSSPFDKFHSDPPLRGQPQLQVQSQQPQSQPTVSSPFDKFNAPSGAQASSTGGAAPATSNSSSNSRKEELLADGRRYVKYRNNTEKWIYPDGKTLVVFTNGDTKRTNPDNGMVIYYYKQANTTHTTYTDGLEVFEFPNGQVTFGVQYEYIRCH